MVYAGIDEAGYGPMFGPLVIGCTAFRVGGVGPTNAVTGLPDLWERLGKAISRKPSRRGGLIAVNDSKKLYSPAQGLARLELGTLCFAYAAGITAETIDDWLGQVDCVGDGCGPRCLPWYAPDVGAADEANLPRACALHEIKVMRNLLLVTATRQDVSVVATQAAVVFEDRFNQMVAATRSKASVNFTYVSGHLHRLWQEHGKEGLVVAVDRQSGRQRYLSLLSQNFPDAHIAVGEESPARSAYTITTSGNDSRSMTVCFEVSADQNHLPVALASMVSKYTRELLMARLQQWFAKRLPAVRPTAGYASDAKRFWAEVEPSLQALSIRPEQLRRAR